MIFNNVQLITPDSSFLGALRLDGATIQEIRSPEDLPFTAAPGEAVWDANGQYILSPGFIDVHIHGAGGADTMDASLESLCTISETISRFGTTSFLATTMTQSPERVRAAVQAVKKWGPEVRGAQILGLHLEGPFISPEAIGAQNPNFVAAPSVSLFQSLVEEAEDLVVTVTLAPERQGAEELIRYLRGKDINAAMGHTKATYEQAKEGMSWGCNHATHLFNAMTGLHHRAPGVVGAVLDSDITAETIADGIHVLWPVLRSVYHLMAPERMILVTDAMMACGMHEGTYSLGGQKVFVKDGAARLEKGALAGSILTMGDAVKNVAQHTDLALHEVLRMATFNPARLCGVADRKGRLAPGYDADLVLLNKDLDVCAVFVQGRLVHQSPTGPFPAAHAAPDKK
ncbi:N-acetylglucosamine-6-phosphate deacetylase [Clostridiaceae bacterium JG1575]|nr:N-acetylglucosamine-6-phosphate deacetylase [Clostridiaceae bacterium JG1575]